MIKATDPRVMRLAVVTSIPTPYRDPFWSEVARQPNVSLDVFYCASGKNDRPWSNDWKFDFNHEVLPGYNLAAMLGDGASCYWNPSIISRLRTTRYDAILVGGYNHVTMLAAIGYARAAHIPFCLMSEVYLDQPRSAWRRIVKAPLVKSIVRNATLCMPTGTLAAEYLTHYGATPQQLVRVPNSPDIDWFEQSARELANERDTLRSQHGLGNLPTILFVGRLIGLKRLDVLLRAFRDVTVDCPAKLLVIGDGPMKTAWQTLTERLELGGQVQFVGFVAPQDLPKWYAMADLFILPSEDETWSVVVLEALASGVPVVVSNRVGCYADVVTDPTIGQVVPFNDDAALARAISQEVRKLTSRENVMNAWAPMRHHLKYSSVAPRVVEALRTACTDQGSPHCAMAD